MAIKKEGIAASAISGIKWGYVGTVGSSISSLVIGIVLARILGPKPFGQTIIATMLYGLVYMFVDGGFSQALIQKPEIDAIDIRKTFTSQVILGLLTNAAVYFSAPWIARAFQDVSAVPVIRALSTIMTLQSLGLVSAALLRRRMQFKAIQVATLGSYLIGYALVGIPLALRGAGVWSLVFTYLSQSLLFAAFLYSAARHPVTPIFSLPDRSITRFGTAIIVNNIVNWGHANLDNFSVGNQMGPTSLGLYGRACNFAYQPVNAAVTGLQSVLLSVTAKVQARESLVRDLALASIGVLLGLVGPAYATFAMSPETTILGLYGAKWIAIVPLMVPMALAMPFYGAHALLGPILCGLGRPELEVWPQGISCAIAAVAYYTAAHFSLMAVAWALFWIMVLRFALICAFLFPLVHISWVEALLLVATRGAFSALFGTVGWGLDRIMRAAHYDAVVRLGGLTVVSMALLGLSVWFVGDVVFGRAAIRFLLSYSSHLPAGLTRQFRLRVASSMAYAAKGS